MIVSAEATSSFTPCPPGTYAARCVRLVDLGTVVSEFQGERKAARKVLVAFEIVDEETRRDDGQPFVLSKRYTRSLHEKSALRRDLAAWRGRDFTAEELRGFDLAAILNTPALVTVSHSEKDGRTFTNLAAITKPPRGMAVPAAAEEPLLWDMDSPDWTAFARLSPKLAAAIEAAPEFKALKQTNSVNLGGKPAAAPAAPAQSPAAHGFEDMTDDVPW